MKRLLLDTHAFLWWLADDAALGVKARAMIADGRNEIYVSAASVWEIGIKQALGKLEAPDDLEKVVEEENFVHLPIALFHAETAGKLQPLHHDPFDRMLVAQAQAEGLIIVTADEHIPRYGVRTMQAKE
ncbi:type II toxin-antitoxin system VapC family toxin [Sulfurivermis fontis]|jgi:PIN domain nuclease of toxin-antitoxin system|uniref:type II toxin-antitoxin system VapC family toxin n=1 Tax=Sulfurivermis fontis TaxID=1972068 RepID=UPI000FDB8C9F|nr:type II toxin-antitoxin system VapC family toxin [Sulfurivermis fontis]